MRRHRSYLAAVLLAAGLLPAGLLPAGLLSDAMSAGAAGGGGRGNFSVRIIHPPTGDFVMGRTRVTAEVDTDEPTFVAKVEFYIDDRLIYIDKEPPYEIVYDFGKEPRSFVLRTDAYHIDNLVVSDTVVTRQLVIHYQVGIDRVILNATALDQDGAFLLDLKQDDFALLEDKTPQKIIDFYLEERPITLALVLDTSGSMHEAIGGSQEAADRFVDTLKENDRALVIDFDEKVFMLQKLTGDKKALKTAIDSTYAEGGTAVYDALHAAFRMLNPEDGRKAIILLTDGDDNNSQFSFKRILEIARTSNVTIYGIGLGSGLRRGPLKDLAQETGGRAFFPGNVKKLAKVYEQVAQELRSQYYLTYSSSNKELDGSFRKITLKAIRPNIEIRTRRGYYAVPPSN